MVSIFLWTFFFCSKIVETTTIWFASKCKLGWQTAIAPSPQPYRPWLYGNDASVVGDMGGKLLHHHQKKKIVT
jgi:hypothetical protein